MKTENELKISVDDFKLIKQFYPEFSRKQGIKSNDFIIGWSEIMPVLEKIRPLVHKIDTDSTAWRRLSGKSIFAKLEDVYKAVVEFIRWYNSQNS